MTSFNRLFRSTLFFGVEDSTPRAHMVDSLSFRFFERLRLWYAKDLHQPRLPGESFENLVMLSDEFFEEIREHPVPVSLDVVKALKDAPGCLDFYTWLAFRSFTARSETRVPLFGESGLGNQLGSPGRGASERKSRNGWGSFGLSGRAARRSSIEGDRLIIRPARAILPQQGR